MIWKVHIIIFIRDTDYILEPVDPLEEGQDDGDDVDGLADGLGPGLGGDGAGRGPVVRGADDGTGSLVYILLFYSVLFSE